jgi:hypothetical protein
MKLVPPGIVPTKVGGSKNQRITLGVLVVVLVVVYLMNRGPSAPDAPVMARSPLNVTPVTTANGIKRRDIPEPDAPQRSGSRGGGLRPVEDFRPSLKLKEGTDVSKIDPTLKLELLAKVQHVPMEGGVRSLFAFGAPPPPPPPPVSAINPGKVTETASNAATTPPPPKPADVKPAAPPAPPIPLKFYGYANSAKGGPKRAFFLDGDDIFVAGENDVIRNRYKIIKIGVNSAVVEDTTNKNQQTLPLVEELAG